MAVNVLEPIFLNSPTEKKQNILSRSLDIISAPLSQPGTTFKKGLGAGADAVRKSREKISSGDKQEALKVAGKTLLSTGIAAGAVLGGGTALGRTALMQAGKKVAGAAAKKPLITLAGVGLATTKGGRDLLTSIPQKTFEGGRIAGKVLGGEETGLSNVGKALAVGGVLGAGAIGGKILIDKLTGDKGKDVLPSVKQLGATDPAPPQILGAISGTPQAQMTGTATEPQAENPQNQKPGFTNIIQISI